VTLFLPLLAFVFVSLLVAAGAMAMSSGPASVVERRLTEIAGEHAGPIVEGGSFHRTMTDHLKRLGELVPKSSSETGKLQRKLVAAGYRRHEAIWMFFGIRIGVAFACFAISSAPIFFRPNLAASLGAAGLGYLLPSMILGRQARLRQHRIRLSLPDALDLLVVSVEAGLGLDQAIQRVGDELAFAHPDLADELRLINLELRAGSARSEALHNLAYRTGVDDVSSLVSMLVQTDKFGTSVAQSLRVHSDTLRTKRRQRAEEAAAKTGVKMVFPLVFCIFPAIWVVTIGPAAIKFVKVLFPLAQQQ
jgi:tight adherence protein C